MTDQPDPKTSPALQTETVGMDAIYVDPANARLHDEGNLDAIKASLRHHGQVESLLVQRSSGRIVGGNGRYQAMKEMGWDKVAVTYLDLTDVEATALSIALNRTAELGQWDREVLPKLLETLKDDFPISELGFDEEALSKLLPNPDDLEAHVGAGGVDETVGEDQPSTGPDRARMVQLYFDEETHPRFMDLADAAQEQFQTDNLTETVLRAMEENAKANSAG